MPQACPGAANAACAPATAGTAPTADTAPTAVPTAEIGPAGPGVGFRGRPGAAAPGTEAGPTGTPDRGGIGVAMVGAFASTPVSPLITCGIRPEPGERSRVTGTGAADAIRLPHCWQNAKPAGVGALQWGQGWGPAPPAPALGALAIAAGIALGPLGAFAIAAGTALGPLGPLGIVFGTALGRVGPVAVPTGTALGTALVGRVGPVAMPTGTAFGTPPAPGTGGAVPARGTAIPGDDAPCALPETASPLPQFRQKFMPGAFSTPQRGQRGGP